MSRQTGKVPASEVRADDFIPGLDNGYVFEDPEESPDIRGAYNTTLGGEDAVLITFHTAEGEEAYLLCPPNMPVTVQRDGGFDDDEPED